MKTNPFYRSSSQLIRLHAQDILNAPRMQQEKKFIQHGNVTCYEHSVFVTFLSLWLADKLRLSVNRRSLIRGALLHDYFLYDWHTKEKWHRLHGFRHAAFALKNAEQDFTLNEVERNIIRSHMFPLNLTLPRCRESLLVNLADKSCSLFETVSLTIPDSVRILVIREIETSCSLSRK